QIFAAERPLCHVSSAGARSVCITWPYGAASALISTDPLLFDSRETRFWALKSEITRKLNMSRRGLRALGQLSGTSRFSGLFSHACVSVARPTHRRLCEVRKRGRPSVSASRQYIIVTVS